MKNFTAGIFWDWYFLFGIYRGIAWFARCTMRSIPNEDEGGGVEQNITEKYVFVSRTTAENLTQK